MKVDTYVSIDLETTGLNFKLDKITEIGAVKVINGKEVASFHSLINPGRLLSERVMEITGIKDEDLTDAPYIQEVLPDFLEFIGDLPILGHSVMFDFSFLKKAAVDMKLTFEKQGLDTLKIARKYLDSLEHRNLKFLCDYYGIELEAHRAENDARATHYLYMKLLENFYSEEDNLFKPQSLIVHVKRDTPATKPQKERLARLLEQRQIEPDYEIERLTRSEASRIIDLILSGKN